MLEGKNEGIETLVRRWRQLISCSPLEGLFPPLNKKALNLRKNIYFHVCHILTLKCLWKDRYLR